MVFNYVPPNYFSFTQRKVITVHWKSLRHQWQDKLTSRLSHVAPELDTLSLWWYPLQTAWPASDTEPSDKPPSQDTLPNKWLAFSNTQRSRKTEGLAQMKEDPRSRPRGSYSGHHPEETSPELRPRRHRTASLQRALIWSRVREHSPQDCWVFRDTSADGMSATSSPTAQGERVCADMRENERNANGAKS